MKRTAALTIVVVGLGLAGMNAAWAERDPNENAFEDKCGSAPFGPDIPSDPTGVTEEKLTEIKNDVVAFIKTSDQFQDCIDSTLRQGPKLDKKLTREQIERVQDRFAREGVKIMSDNQAEKERIGEAFNALVDARKKGGAAPKPPAAPKPQAAPAIPNAPAGMLPVAPDARPTAKAKPIEKPVSP